MESVAVVTAEIILLLFDIPETREYTSLRVHLVSLVSLVSKIVINQEKLGTS